MLTGEVRIMWKAIIIEFVVLYIVSNIICFYIIKKYQKIVTMYNNNEELNKIRLEAEKLLDLSYFFAVGPWNKKMYLLYNGLCWLLATICYMEKDERGFLIYLERVKKEKEFELKSFVLTLYYRAKQVNNQVKYYCMLYENSVHKDDKISIIMGYIMGKIDEESLLEESVNNFKNPVIIELLEKNKLCVHKK